MNRLAMSIDGLHERAPELSARQTLSKGQRRVFLGALLLLVLSLVVALPVAAIALVTLGTAVYLLTFMGWLRLAMAASRLDVWHARALCRLSRAVLPAVDRRLRPMSLITLVVKRTRKLLAGNPHEQFDVAGAGNGLHGVPRLPSTLPTSSLDGAQNAPPTTAHRQSRIYEGRRNT